MASDTYNVNLVKDDTIMSHKTGALHGMDYDDIVTILGEPNVYDDPGKVRWSWGFRVMPDNIPMAIWDWKGSADMGRWSIYGDEKIWVKLFPMAEIS
mgnify:FL=1|tara:strand:- start:75 stop:365 length:291 start_codon:yes stop_codon:yes gene_type:complete